MTNPLPRLGLTAACAVLLLAAGGCDRLMSRDGNGETPASATATDTAAADKAVAEAKADTAETGEPAAVAEAAPTTAEAAPAAPETPPPAEKK